MLVRCFPMSFDREVQGWRKGCDVSSLSLPLANACPTTANCAVCRPLLNTLKDAAATAAAAASTAAPSQMPVLLSSKPVDSRTMLQLYHCPLCPHAGGV